MTIEEIVLLVGEYRTGLETEMVLLRRLATLSAQQATAARTGNTDGLIAVTEQRDSVMASFVTIEHGLKPIRLKLAESRHLMARLPEFRELGPLHREAGALVADLVGSDRHALDALKEAETARQLVARALEQGESTLAAYRRVVIPATAGAALVDRKG